MATNKRSITELFTLENPVATEFRRLLHRLTSNKSSKPIQSILISSATVSEGKSTVAAMMAVTSAQNGASTLLVDSDLRRPSVHRLFSFDRSPGIIDLLLEQGDRHRTIHRTAIPSLDVICAGQSDQEPASVFDAAAIGRLIAQWKRTYDLIIVDCAPIIPVSDPMLLSAEVDGTLLVVRAGKTPQEVVTRAVDIMKASSAHLLGVVLNNVNSQLPYYYDYRYFDYSYRSESGTKSSAQIAPSSIPSDDSTNRSSKTSTSDNESVNQKN